MSTHKTLGSKPDDQIAADLGHLVPSGGVVDQVNAIGHARLVAVGNLKKIDGHWEADSVQATIGLGGSITSTQGGNFTATILPEPASMTLIGAGLIAIAMVRKRRKARV